MEYMLQYGEGEEMEYILQYGCEEKLGEEFCMAYIGLSDIRKDQTTEIIRNH